MMWMPRLFYNGVTLNLTHPQGEWMLLSRKFGGREVSGAGVPEGFTRRREERARVRLVFFESEWAAVRTAVAWMQDNPGTSWTYYFEQDDVTTSYTVYLEEPNDEIEPVKSGEYPGMRELVLTIRTTAGAVFTVQQYA